MTRSFIDINRSRPRRGLESRRAVRSTTREQTHDGWYEDEIVEHLSETVLPDRARSVITNNKSPDVGFDQSINSLSRLQPRLRVLLARPTHAYLASLGPGFRDKSVLQGRRGQDSRGRAREAEIRLQTHRAGHQHRWYQTAGKAAADHRAYSACCPVPAPVTIVTKSALVVRDIDLLTDLARDRLCPVMVSITS